MFRVIVWLMVPTLIGVLTWYSHKEYDPGFHEEPAFRESFYSDVDGLGEPFHIVLPVVMSAVLPVGLGLMRRFPGKVIPRMLAFVGTVLSVYWLSVPLLVLTNFLEYTHANPVEISLLSLFVTVVAGIFSAVYAIYIAPSEKML